MYVFNVHLQRIFSNYISRQNTNDNIHLTQYDFIFSLLSYYTDLFHNIGLSRHSSRVLLPLLHLLSPSKRVRQVHPLLPPDKSLINVFLKHSIKRRRRRRRRRGRMRRRRQRRKRRGGGGGGGGKGGGGDENH